MRTTTGSIMGEPRYYVRYQCRKDGPQLPATHFAFVRDSWYCHRDIRRFEQTGGGRRHGKHSSDGHAAG